MKTLGMLRQTMRIAGAQHISKVLKQIRTKPQVICRRFYPFIFPELNLTSFSQSISPASLQ